MNGREIKFKLTNYNALILLVAGDDAVYTKRISPSFSRGVEFIVILLRNIDIDFISNRRINVRLRI